MFKFHSIQKRRGEYDPLVEEIASLITSNEERTFAQILLQKLFNNVPDSSRVIAILHLHDGYTLDETAKAIGMSVSGVRKRLRVLNQNLNSLESQ